MNYVLTLSLCSKYYSRASLDICYGANGDDDDDDDDDCNGRGGRIGEQREEENFKKITANQLLSVCLFYPCQLIRICYLSGSAAAIVPSPPTKGLPGNIELSIFFSFITIEYTRHLPGMLKKAGS